VGCRRGRGRARRRRRRPRRRHRRATTTTTTTTTRRAGGRTVADVRHRPSRRRARGSDGGAASSWLVQPGHTRAAARKLSHSRGEEKRTPRDAHSPTRGAGGGHELLVPRRPRGLLPRGRQTLARARRARVLRRVPAARPRPRHARARASMRAGRRLPQRDARDLDATRDGSEGAADTMRGVDQEAQRAGASRVVVREARRRRRPLTPRVARRPGRGLARLTSSRLPTRGDV